MIFNWPHDPAWNPMAGRFRLRTISQMSASPYTGAVKAVGLGQVWTADLTFNNHDMALGHDMQGFLESLEGPVNPVRLFDWWRRVPALLSSAASGFSDGTFFTDGTGFTDGWAPLVLTAASKGARQVAIEGLPESQDCFTRGDLIGLGGSLYQIRAGVTSNSSGQALLNILPGLRAGVAAGDAITLWRPTVAMRLLPGDEGINRAFNISEGFSLSFVEDVA